MITVHHLNESRSIRILWLLEELGLDYRIERYSRDPVTRLAPESLRQIHPLGKSPLITDGSRVIHESGAIIDYVIRRHGQGQLQPAPETEAYDEYQQWLHYGEGSAMLPLMLNLYVSRIGEAGAPLHGRIDSEIANHLGYLDSCLAGRRFLVGDRLTGADIQMAFVGQAAGMFGRLGSFSNIADWMAHLQSRPAYQAAQAKA